MPNFLRGTGTSQTTYTSGPTGVISPTTVTFNAVQDSAGTAVVLDTNSSVFTLQANKSYRLIASVNSINTSGPNVKYQWYNQTGSVLVGSVGYTQRDTAGSLGLAEAVFTPLVTTTVVLQARPTNNANTFVNIFSIGEKWFDIQALEDGASPSGNISVSNITVSNNLSAGGNILAGNLAVGSGFVSAGNIISAGPVSSALTVSAAGNVIGANFRTVGAITATGNITGNYFIGNGSQLTGISPALIGTMSGNISANGFTINGLPALSVSGNVLSAGAISAVGNVSGTYFIGNGSLLTGITASGSNYSNANVAAYLPTYSGTLTAGAVSASGNVRGSNLLTAGVVSAVGQVITPATVSAGNVTTNGVVVATGNVSTSGFFIGNGSRLTGMGGPIVLANNSTNQNFPAGSAQTILKFTNTLVNTGNYYNVSNGRFTPLVSGYYQVNTSVSPELVSSFGIINSSFFIALYKNGILVGAGGSTVVTPTWGQISSSTISIIVYFNGSTDYLTVECFSTISGGVYRFGISAANYFQTCWLRS